jgi:hypothetical protein
MPKKRTKRASSTRHHTLETSLAENIIQLQKVHTDMAEKFDKLTKQISSLLALFETTARSFATNPNIKMAEKDKEFLDKIDKLLDQNKTIAKGLTLMEHKIREKMYGPINTPTYQAPQQHSQTQNHHSQAPQQHSQPPNNPGMIPSRPIRKF